MGCDISHEKCGIRDIGRVAFLSALESFEDEEPSVIANVPAQHCCQQVGLHC